MTNDSITSTIQVAARPRRRAVQDPQFWNEDQGRWVKPRHRRMDRDAIAQSLAEYYEDEVA